VTDEAAAELLAQLVGLPSVNPAFQRAGDDPSWFGEARYSQWLRDYLLDRGFEAWLEEVLPGRPNLMARLAGRDGDKRVVLLSHLDTVQVTDMVVPPWGERRGQRFVGRGSCDTKASMVSFIMAMELLRATGGTKTDVFLCGTIDEESGCAGSSWLSSKHKFDACIVGEPTELRPVVAHKGAVRFELVADGLACHSSTPELGHNAILEMLQLLGEFSEMFGEQTSLHGHPLTGEATWTPTVIRGGSGVNTVPGECWVVVDRRLVPGEDADSVLDLVDTWMENHRQAGKPWRRGRTLVVDPAFAVELGAPVVVAVQKALARRGLLSDPAGIACGTDASKMAAAGIPSLVFGPGSLKQAHTADEWVDLGSIREAASIVADAVHFLDESQ
jgi:acetylornithine deacetylase/succinyl-diaminopimelate desuccinylase-like protein